MSIERDLIPVRWRLPISRRSVLRGGATAAKGLAAVWALTSIGLFEETEKPYPRELPSDVLSEETLKRAKIKIYQAPEIKLYLRESALQFPLFQDAAKGKLDQVVIVLVDHPKIDTDASQGLKEDAKVLIQQVLNYSQGTIDRRNVLGLMLSGRSLVNGVGPEFLKENPQFANKVYIYLAVGGDLKPDPGESFPNPHQFEKHKSSLLGSIAYDRKSMTKSRGFVLNHEIHHYNPLGDAHGELATDLLTVDHIAGAWRKYQETGDTAGYPFVFVTNKGITITADLHQNQVNNI